MDPRVNLIATHGAALKQKPDLVSGVVQELIRNIFLNRELRSKIISAVTRCPSVVLERCYESLTNDELSYSGKNGYSSKIRALISDRDDLSVHELNEALVFYPALDRVGEVVSRMLVAALHDCRLLPNADDYTQEGDEVLAQCFALVRVMGGTFESFNMTPYRGTPNGLVFKDDALTELVLEFPERADEIIDAICTRRSFDAELIRSVTSGVAVALGSGTL